MEKDENEKQKEKEKEVEVLLQHFHWLNNYSEGWDEFNQKVWCFAGREPQSQIGFFVTAKPCEAGPLDWQLYTHKSFLKAENPDTPILSQENLTRRYLKITTHGRLERLVEVLRENLPPPAVSEAFVALGDMLEYCTLPYEVTLIGAMHWALTFQLQPGCFYICRAALLPDAEKPAVIDKYLKQPLQPNTSWSLMTLNQRRAEAESVANAPTFSLHLFDPVSEETKVETNNGGKAASKTSEVLFFKLQVAKGRKVLVDRIKHLIETQFPEITPKEEKKKRKKNREEEEEAMDIDGEEEESDDDDDDAGLDYLAPPLQRFALTRHTYPRPLAALVVNNNNNRNPNDGEAMDVDATDDNANENDNFEMVPIITRAANGSKKRDRDGDIIMGDF
jgi:hypothetical protein